MLIQGDQAALLSGPELAAHDGMQSILVGTFGVLVLLAGGCHPGPEGGPDGGSDGGTVVPKGTVSAILRVDNMGWRTADRKVAVLIDHAATAVQLIDASSGAVAGDYTSS